MRVHGAPLDDIARSTAAVLATAGRDARACYDGETAVALAATYRPDVCMPDLAMRGMGGIELADRLQDQLNYPVRLTALTDQRNPEANHRTHNAGFERHLDKPVDSDTLVEAITAPALADV